MQKIGVITCGCTSGTTVHSASKVIEDVQENLFVAFTVAEHKSEGKCYLRNPAAPVHFANADSGAMVTCISSGVLAAYPNFRHYFEEGKDVVYGLGNHACEILGVLRKVPVSLGTEQEKGSIVYCNFKVVRDHNYCIILGLDVLAKIHALIGCNNRTLYYKRGPAAGEDRTAQLVLYPRSQVNMQPTVRQAIR